MSDVAHAKPLFHDETIPLETQHGAAGSESHLPPLNSAICPNFQGKSPSECGFGNSILGLGRVYGLEIPESNVDIAKLLFGLALGPGGKAADATVKFQALKTAVERVTREQQLLQLTRQSELAQKLAPFINGVGTLLYGNPLGWAAKTAADKLRAADKIDPLAREKFAKLLDEVGKAYDAYIAGRVAK